MFSRTSFAEEGIERVIAPANSLVRWHMTCNFQKINIHAVNVLRFNRSITCILIHTVWLDAMFQTVQFPTSVADLYACLADMNGNALSLKFENKNVHMKWSSASTTHETQLSEIYF